MFNVHRYDKALRMLCKTIKYEAYVVPLIRHFVIPTHCKATKYLCKKINYQKTAANIKILLSEIADPYLIRPKRFYRGIRSTSTQFSQKEKVTCQLGTY